MELIVKEIEDTFTLEVPSNITLRICDEEIIGPTLVGIPCPKLIEKLVIETVEMGYEHNETKEMIPSQEFLNSCEELGAGTDIWETIEERDRYYKFRNSYTRKSEILKKWVPVDFKIYKFAKSDNPMIKSLRIIANANPAFSYYGNFEELFKKANEITQANYTWEIKIDNKTHNRVNIASYSKLNGSYLLNVIHSSIISVGSYEECQAAYEKDLAEVVSLFRMTQAKQFNTQVFNVATIHSELQKALSYSDKIGYNKKNQTDWRCLRNSIINAINQLKEQANGTTNS